MTSHRFVAPFVRSLALALVLPACGDTVEHASAAQHGAALAADPTASRSRYNHVACLTCHAARPGDAGNRILPGAPFEGVARRPSYWDGGTVSLREAVDRCWEHFMRGVPADLDGPTGLALQAWLQALSPGSADAGTAPVTWTYPRSVLAVHLPAGDATRGAELYSRACASCHGAPDRGPVISPASHIPCDTLAEHDQPGMVPAGMSRGEYIRAIVTEKVRHGSYLGYAGVMPPFAQEILDDQALADILEYLHLPTDTSAPSPTRCP